MSAAPAPISPAAEAPLTEPARLLNVFAAPSSTFRDVRRVSRWWVPWLLITVFSYALIATVAQRVGFEQVTENQIKLSPRRAAQLDRLTPEQRAEQMARAAGITRAISYAFPVVNLVIFAVIAAVAMATFNFLLGAEISFPTSLGIVTYANLPGIIKAVLAMVLLLAGLTTENFNFSNPLASNPGALVDPGTAPGLYRLASSLDVFSMWVLVLAGIGFATVSKVKRTTSIAVMFGWYFFVVLVGAGFAALFS